eukprot:TRINITY_DN3840_c2_g1_i2.p1 TRINITY_DN3840_c2_g1~~TRINITY_DN3840_c2_g1_i2.p1  ORF type:complete len:239 (+),score=85.27 TRINITY_DN3840_c2_g1_i2:75-719(+)
MAAAQRCKNEFKKITGALEKQAKGEAGAADQAWLPPQGVILNHNVDQPSKFRVQIDCNTAFEALGGSPDVRQPVHYGGGDDGTVYPRRTGASACPIACKDAYRDIIFEVELDVGPTYGKYKFGDEGKDISLNITFLTGWEEASARPGFAHNNISAQGKVSIGNEKSGMYCTQSPFVPMCGGDGKWSPGTMNVTVICRHLLMLLENPFMVRCGDD